MKKNSPSITPLVIPVGIKAVPYVKCSPTTQGRKIASGDLPPPIKTGKRGRFWTDEMLREHFRKKAEEQQQAEDTVTQN